MLVWANIKSDLLFEPCPKIPLQSPFTISIKKTRLMSSRCPVHQVKIKTNIITLYWLHKSTLLFSKNNHILEIKLDKSDILLYKVLLHHCLPQDLSGPNQGSMVMECCTICSTKCKNTQFTCPAPCLVFTSIQQESTG